MAQKAQFQGQKFKNGENWALLEKNMPRFYHIIECALDCMHGYLQKCNFRSKNVYLSVFWPKKLSFRVKKFKNGENWALLEKKHALVLPYYWMCIKL